MHSGYNGAIELSGGGDPEVILAGLGLCLRGRSLRASLGREIVQA